MKLNGFKKDKGFSMIELMISLFILSFGLIAVYSVFSNAVAATNNISSRLTGAYLAKEGMEIVRNIRDSNFGKGKNWSKGLLGCKKGCQGDYKTNTSAQTPLNELKEYDDSNFLSLNPGGLYGYDSGIPTKFKRKITIEEMSKDILKVDVLVMWSYNSKPFSFATGGYFYNWH